MSESRIKAEGKETTVEALLERSDDAGDRIGRQPEMRKGLGLLDLYLGPGFLQPTG